MLNQLAQPAQPATKAMLYGKEVNLTRAANDHIAIVPTSRNGKRDVIPLAQLNLAFARGHLVFPFEVPDELPEAANQSEAQRLAQDILLQYVHRLDQQEYKRSRRIAKMVINEVKRELGDTQPPSESTLLRAHERYVKYGNLMRFPRKRPTHFHDAASDLFIEIVDDMYLQLNGASIDQCWKEYKKQAALRFEGKIKHFSRSTFYERIKLLNRIEVIETREGKKASRNDARIVYRSLITSRILERIEMDAVHINIGLMNDDGEIVTQVILYTLIDCYSRCILGYHLQVAKKYGEKSKQGENTVGIMQSLIHSLSPKPNMSFEGGKYHWNMYSSGENYITDAGGPYASHEIGGFINAAGGNQHIAEAGAGYRKPYIERFFGTLRTQCLSIIPGYMGKLKEAKEYDQPIHKHACMSVKEFESLLANYIVTQYHQTPHKGLQLKTPQQVWDETLHNSTTLLRMHDINRLVRANITPIMRTLQGPKGIEFNKTFYNAKALKNLYNVLSTKGGKNPKVECIFTPLEPEHAWVKNPITGELIMLHAKSTSEDSNQNVSWTEDEILGADIPFGFNHPLIACARQERQANFDQKKKGKKPRELNTEAVADQFDIFKAQSQQDVAPSFEKPDQNEPYSSYFDQDDDDEFEGVELDDK